MRHFAEGADSVIHNNRQFCRWMTMFLHPSLSISCRLTVLLLVVAFAVLLLAMDRNLGIYDEGLILVGAMRVTGERSKRWSVNVWTASSFKN